MSRLRTPLTELVGIEHPVVQTGMGWVAGARLVAATSNAGGLGILASATMTLDELRDRGHQGEGDAPISRSASTSVPTRAMPSTGSICSSREGVKVASFALAPKPDLIAKLKEAGVVVIPSVGLAKHAKKVAGWGADAVIVQGGEGGGHTGPGRHHAAVAVGARRRGHSRSLPRADSSTAAGWPPRCPTARRASRWAPASC